MGAGFQKTASNFTCSMSFWPFSLDRLPQHEAGKNGARVVTMARVGFEETTFRGDGRNCHGGKTYDAWSRHGQENSADTHLTNELVQRRASKNTAAIVLHSGVILKTGITQAKDLDSIEGAEGDRSRIRFERWKICSAAIEDLRARLFDNCCCCLTARPPI